MSKKGNPGPEQLVRNLIERQTAWEARMTREDPEEAVRIQCNAKNLLRALESRQGDRQPGIVLVPDQPRPAMSLHAPRLPIHGQTPTPEISLPAMDANWCSRYSAYDDPC